MPGRILAINENFGYRPVLVVKEIRRIHQRDAQGPSTVLAGDQVLLPFSPTGTASVSANDVGFSQFLQQYLGRWSTWNQLRSIPHESYDEYVEMWPKLPVRSIAQARVKLLASGTDPIHGAWCQFEGDHLEIFFQPYWWQETEDELW